MAHLILFHHALGLTDGVAKFADRLRSAGHSVATPDLFDANRFDNIDAGVAYAERIGFDLIIERGINAVANAPADCVFAGFSLGTLPAQKLAQTRPGALGAILYHGGIPASNFNSSWPAGAGLQIHQVANDKWAEIEAARELVRESTGGDLYIYPGTAHLVADSSFTEYDAPTAELMIERSIAFLNRYKK